MHGWFAFLIHPFVLVFVGSGVGGVCRYALARWINLHPWAAGFPWGTLIVNVLGSFLLTVIALVILERLNAAYRPYYLLLGTGFCGGFTTFSTLQWESFELARSGAWHWVLLNFLGSCVAGFLAVLLGVAVVVIVSRLS